MKYSQFCGLVKELVSQGCEPDPELVVKAGDDHPKQQIAFLAVYHTGKKLIIWCR